MAAGMYENPLSKVVEARRQPYALQNYMDKPDRLSIGDTISPPKKTVVNPGTYYGVETPLIPGGKEEARILGERQARFNKTTELYPHERLMEKAFKSLPTSIMPTHARVFLESVNRKRSPISERDFTPPQRNVMRDSVRNAYENQTQYSAKGNSASHGQVTYSDYPWARKMYDDVGGREFTKEDFSAGFLSSLFKDPDDSVSHTLGSFTYDKPPLGGINITDKYDFATLGDKEITGWKDALRHPYAAIQQYGTKKMPSGEVNKGGFGYAKVPTNFSGRQVNIHLGDEYEPEYARDAGKLPRDASTFSQGIGFPGDPSIYKDLYSRIKANFSNPFKR